VRFGPLIFVLLLTTLDCFPAGVDLVSGRGIRNPVVETEINRGIIKFVEGDLSAARHHYDEALRLDPKAWQAYYDRAVLSIKERKFDLAMRDLNESIRLRSAYLRAAVLRAEVNEHLGKYEEALAELDHLQKICVSTKTGEDVYNGRAWIRATSRNPAFRNGRLAVDDAIRACNLSKWQSPFSLDTLAAAYAETGDFDSAVRYERKAIETVSNVGKTPAYIAAFRKLFEQRLASFEQHKRPSYE